ncbi:MAG: hypothetical protein ACI8P0_000987 [Planctomycetaceae bacterium]|jgi:hypothetical protein
MNWRDEVAMHQEEVAIHPEVARPPESTEVQWQAPLPLPDGLLPVEPFRFELLPKVFQPWVQDIAERLQCPADFPAVGIMVVVAGIVGRKIGIRPQERTDWLVVPNLWGTVIGRPGIMKTPALQEPLRMLRHFEIDAKQQFDSAMSDLQDSQIVAKVEKKVLEESLKKAFKAGNGVDDIVGRLSQLDQPTPIRHRYLVSDCTVEKLGELLKENPNGVTVFRDELTGLLKTLDKEGHEGARAFYLESWNGDGRFTYDRIGRGTIDIPAAIVSIIGGIQPGPLGDYLKRAANGGAGDDGLLQRFQLAVWPDCQREWKNVDRFPDGDARRQVFDTCNRLNEMNAVELAAERCEFETVPFLRFDKDAQESFNEWRGDLERKLRSDTEHPAIESHLAKYRSLIPSLALLCHLVDEPNGGPVSAESLNRAIAWGSYLESHARRIYGSIAHRTNGAATALAARIRDGSLKDDFTLRDVYRSGWSRLSERSDAQAAVDLLIDHGWLHANKIDTGGAPKTEFRINPASLDMD